MRRPRIRGLDERRPTVLTRRPVAPTIGARVAELSRLFLGAPYAVAPLIGSATEPEVFTASLDAFDCVTYVETMLALARASESRTFLDELRAIRYATGEVAWRRRNHYMTSWIRNNVRAGRLHPVGRGLERARERLLDAVPGLPARKARFPVVPKRSWPALRSRLESGDLLFFAATRPGLDVFHCGIAVEGPEGWTLRHATKSRGAVVDEKLEEFVAGHRMAGIMVVRP